MQKTKVEWTDYSWNPIKGVCPVDCKLPDGRSYCYARRIYQRFKWNPKMEFELHDPIAIDRLHYKNVPTGSKVFVCSTFELFHPKVPKSWRKDIFSVIKCNPKITFQILTKFPQNIDCPMPDNCWIGTTITSPEDFESRNYHLGKKEVKARLKFWSIEPLLGDIIEPMLDKDGSWKYIAEEEKIRWIIIGRLTGYGHKYNPKWDWINRIVSYARHYHIPIFLKNNLKEIWGESLIQEFPVSHKEYMSTKGYENG